jgi:hypothetical protein
MWKLRITYKKKSKKKVDQFKFETPTTPQVDELNPTQTSIQPSQQIEPFRNIETDSILYELLKQWAANNNINNRQLYKSYINTNPTITLNGRTFELPKYIENTKFYGEVLQPFVDNVLTKKIFFQILDSYFKNQDIKLSNDSYAKFVANHKRTISIPNPITGKKKVATGILFNGQLYPIPNELRTDKLTGNKKFDIQAMSWLREYQKINLNVQGNADENTKKLWEADDNTLREIIKEIIQQMVTAEMKIDRENFSNFAQNKLPKLKVKINDRINNMPFYEKNGTKYLIYAFNKNSFRQFQRDDNTNSWSKIWKEEASPNYPPTWGAEQYLKKAMPSFKREFSEYSFRTEVPVHEIDNNFIPWINEFQIEQIKKPIFNREVLFNFLQNEFKGQPFRLATIKNADSFKIIPQGDGLYTIQVTRILRNKGPQPVNIPNQTFGNVQPGKFALDFVVYKNNIPIAIYEYDGEFHYGQGQYAKTDLMSDVINDQIQKYYIENKTNIPYYRVPYFLVGSSDKFPEFVKNHLKTMI